MITHYSNHNFSKYKPDGLLQPIRFFIFALLVTAMCSCSANKKISETALASNGKEVIPIPDSIPKRYRQDALFMDAVSANMQNDKDKAFRIFTEFAKVSPNNATVHYELSRLWLERNNFDFSIKESKRAVELDSTNKWMQMQYADLLAYNGSFKEAADIYRKIALQERTPEEYLFKQAILLQKAKKYDDALKVYDHLALFLGENDENLLLQRQQLMLSKNDVEGAAGETRKLIKFYPKEPQYVILLASIYENNNVPEKAEEAYKDLEKKFPDDSDAQNAVLRYYLRSKDLKNVMKSLELIVLNKKFSATDRINLLLPFIQNINIDSSVKQRTLTLVREFAEQQPPQKEAIMLWADVSVANGNLDTALYAYKKVIDLDSSFFNPWQQIMYIYSIKALPDSVIEYSKIATKYFPDNYMPFYLEGLSYAQKKQNELAIVSLNEAKQKIPKEDKGALADLLVSLGDVYNTVGNFKQSDSCYEVVLHLQPNNVTALNNFSYYLSLRNEKLDIAEKMSAKSLQLRPNEASFLDTYGWILYRQGKYQEAKGYIQQAIDYTGTNGDDASLWEHLGDVEYKLGNKTKALEHWEKSMSKGVHSEELQQKIKEQKLRD